MTDTAEIAAIVLAAGLSRRAAPRNKLLAPMDGKPLIRRTAENLLASRARPVILVTGHRATEVADALAGCDVAVTHNADYATGMASSIRRGLGAAPEGAHGALVCLGDMPAVQTATIDRLIDAHAPDRICVPVHDGRRGNPVLFDRSFFPALMEIDGDRGGKAIVATNPERVIEVAVDDPGIHLDHDTVEDQD